MTSIIIPLAANGFGSRWADTELKYCFRSIEKHLTGYGDIFLIGHKPSWVQNVIHIPATDEDQTFWKERNIYNKIFIACNDERVSEDFLFMNDDHFLLKDYVAGGFPYYCYGAVADYINHPTQYGNTVAHTLSIVPEYWPYFDVHCPIVYNKTVFKSLQEYDWSKKYGYCIKSLYMLAKDKAGVNFQAIEHPDLKINEVLGSQQIKRRIDGAHWFSMANRAREGGMGKVLDELYPNKSKYER